MPVYEYLCRTCDTRFEARRSMDQASDPIACPDGHGDTTRVLSVFASIGRDQVAAPAGWGQAASGGGGCGCGGACSCAS